MTITVTVEDGSVVSGANAYEAVATAAAWLVDRGFSSFNSASTANQSADLVEATALLEAEWGHLLGGYLVNEDQTLLWPRSGADDWRGVILDSDTVPEGWKAAARILAEYRRQAMDASRRIVGTDKLAGVKEFKDRNVSVAWSGAGKSRSLAADFPEAWQQARMALPRQLMRLRRA